ncbi:UDP-3-O-acyl-N-acetylglucosamine deacetylase [Blastochloris sulfoviridis]|uniref:UDP-3-O-acyl-N-acetylglucosamine deacetylase n=1 Tax=Blastochloris sulfoviridis TaxID=50712 RepID=A0A5M6I339_9HYPH|nr:UDP-3-O-acyl-N-acetylglucosamine deacetylase [Blastochloris sulfoviridis]KAA5602309.1 UDP-3-O-acyl-N-acetylglucosamine deacetylase [Blastochloris sulfoviridis]
MKAGRQTTVRDRIVLTGLGVHSGALATLSLLPAKADTGIVFLRVGDEGERSVRVGPDSVSTTELATVLGDDSGAVVATVEHLLAALSGLGVDNAICEIDGPEVPIMDGSAAAFVAAIEAVGLRTLAAPRRCIRILKPIKVAMGRGWGELRPRDGGLRVEVEIDFDNPTIGRQAYAADIDPATFRRDLARARTFGFLADVSRLWGAGYALGASLDNTLVVAEDRVLNPEGLRYADEFVRHKTLDAIGDLALAGAPLIGLYRSYCGGHRLNYAVVRALLADATAWCWTDALAERPAASRPSYAGRGAQLAMPAFRADHS